MGTKAERARVRRYVRSKGCHLIEAVILAADDVIGVPVPSACHTDETKAMVRAMEALRLHATGLERTARIIKREAVARTLMQQETPDAT